MKKFLGWALALMMLLTFASCAGGGNLEGEATENGGTDQTPGGLENENSTDPEGDQSLASRLVDDFKLMLDEDNMMGSAALAQELFKGDHISFESKSEEIKPGKLAGFKKEITGFKEGMMITPAKGDDPFITYIFTLEDSTDTSEFVAMLKENADVEWNGSAKADEMMAEGLGKMVLFVMSPKSIGK